MTLNKPPGHSGGTEETSFIEGDITGQTVQKYSSEQLKIQVTQENLQSIHPNYKSVEEGGKGFLILEIPGEGEINAGRVVVESEI